jgi:hypothetical protein
MPCKLDIEQAIPSKPRNCLFCNILFDAWQAIPCVHSATGLRVKIIGNYIKLLPEESSRLESSRLESSRLESSRLESSRLELFVSPCKPQLPLTARSLSQRLLY